jgi:hypothetical protein
MFLTNGIYHDMFCQDIHAVEIVANTVGSSSAAKLVTESSTYSYASLTKGSTIIALMSISLNLTELSIIPKDKRTVITKKTATEHTH